MIDEELFCKYATPYMTESYFSDDFVQNREFQSSYLVFHESGLVCSPDLN